MFVVGTDGMLPHPGGRKTCCPQAAAKAEKIPRPCKTCMLWERYNQHISDQAILVEIGGDGNLLEECLESARYLAEVLNDVMMEGK